MAMKCTQQKSVIKVNIYCQICKSESLKAVTKLTGVDMVAVDGEKGTLTVEGAVDPVLVVKQLRKIGKIAEIISVGPQPPPKPSSNVNLLDMVTLLLTRVESAKSFEGRDSREA